jgi:phage shock protein PspC (stress-responsive transcriptional regulator)
MNLFIVILGLIVGYLWQGSLKQEKFVIDVDHKDKIIFGLCASLADKYKANIWVVRFFAFFVLNFGYVLMYLLLPKTQDQSPSHTSKDAQSVNFKEKSKEKVKIEIE